jgi:putative transposase
VVGGRCYVRVMSGYRLYPTPAQEAVLGVHWAQARFMWNLACEQHSWWRPGRAAAPGWAEQCRQLTEARGEFGWLRAGSQMVQQQALRDFAQAMTDYFAWTHARPTWRKAGRHEGFRIVAFKPGHARRLSRKTGEVWVPKAGWVQFRWSRPLPEDTKSYRITLDRAGRWHIAFAAIPELIPALGTGEVVGIDRGVAVSAALSTGQMLSVPRPSRCRQRRLLLLQRKLARARRGSRRRTSQRCSACGHVAAESRESQALFRCVACGYASLAFTSGEDVKSGTLDPA